MIGMYVVTHTHTHTHTLSLSLSLSQTQHLDVRVVTDVAMIMAIPCSFNILAIATFSTLKHMVAVMEHLIASPIKPAASRIEYSIPTLLLTMLMLVQQSLTLSESKLNNAAHGMNGVDAVWW
jgi:hypothetical protein